MIIFLEKDKTLYCQNSDLSKWSIFASISFYQYFYGKKIVINRQEFIFHGMELDGYERHEDEVIIESVEVYAEVNIKSNQEFKKEVLLKQERLTAGSLLNMFKLEYEEEHGIKYVMTDEMRYKRKIRNMMDQFYMSEFADRHIRNYIRRGIKFGNHNGDPIYLDWYLKDSVIQNYLLYIKGLRDITAVWQYLDVQLSPFEIKKIRYIMNLKNFDELTKHEKEICIKLYKRYNKKTYIELSEKYDIDLAFLAKKKLFDLLVKEYDLPTRELLEKTKHVGKYLEYEYTKKQLKEILEK